MGRVLFCFYKTNVLNKFFKGEHIFNQITVIGNICQDIKLSYTQSGVAFLNNAIASSYKYTTNDGTIKEEVCYLNFSVFGRLTENMNPILAQRFKNLFTRKNGSRKLCR